MKKRKPRPVRIPGVVSQGINKASRARKAYEIAKPMRIMFAMLKNGEAYEHEGHLVMKMTDDETGKPMLAAVAPAIQGWIECWRRIDKGLKTSRLRYLAERIEQGKEITEGLVQGAHDEFEECIKRIENTPDGVITSAINTTLIQIEMERLNGHTE